MSKSKSVRVGERIKKAREKNGFSQTKLAQKIGITTRILQNVESGEYKVPEEILVKIGKILGFDPDNFEPMYKDNEGQDSVPAEFLEDDEVRRIVEQYDELTEKERKEIFDGAHKPKNTRH